MPNTEVLQTTVVAGVPQLQYPLDRGQKKIVHRMQKKKVQCKQPSAPLGALNTFLGKGMKREHLQGDPHPNEK